MNMYHIELTKPNGSNIKTNIPARDVVELQKIVDKQYAGYRIKSRLTSEELEQRERLNQRLAGRSGSVAGWHIDDAFPPHLD